MSVIVFVLPFFLFYGRQMKNYKKGCSSKRATSFYIFKLRNLNRKGILRD